MTWGGVTADQLRREQPRLVRQPKTSSAVETMVENTAQQLGVTGSGTNAEASWRDGAITAARPTPRLHRLDEWTRHGKNGC